MWIQIQETDECSKNKSTYIDIQECPRYPSHNQYHKLFILYVY